jgi:hypothetical protein
VSRIEALAVFPVEVLHSLRQRRIGHIDEGMDVRRHLTEREHGPCMGARNLLEECYPSAAVTVIHEVRPIAGGVRPDVVHAGSAIPRC